MQGFFSLHCVPFYISLMETFQAFAPQFRSYGAMDGGFWPWLGLYGLEQRGIFIVLHRLWYATLGFAVNLNLVDFWDKQGVLKIFSNPDTHMIKMLKELRPSDKCDNSFFIISWITNGTSVVCVYLCQRPASRYFLFKPTYYCNIIFFIRQFKKLSLYFCTPLMSFMFNNGTLWKIWL